MTPLMKPNPELSERDAELLSSYLDAMLTDEERIALEKRLQEDAGLRAELRAMRQTVTLINQMPILKAPRDLTIPVDTVRLKPEPKLTVLPRRNAPIWLSVAAAFAVVLVGVTLLLPNLSAPRPETESIASVPTMTAELVMQFSVPVEDGVVGGAADAQSSAPVVEEVANVAMDTASGGAGTVGQEATTMSFATQAEMPPMASPMPASQDNIAMAVVEPTIDPQARTIESTESENDVMQTTGGQEDQAENTGLAELSTLSEPADAPTAKLTTDALFNFLLRLLITVLQGFNP